MVARKTPNPSESAPADSDLPGDSESAPGLAASGLGLMPSVAESAGPSPAQEPREGPPGAGLPVGAGRIPGRRPDCPTGRSAGRWSPTTSELTRTPPSLASPTHERTGLEIGLKQPRTRITRALRLVRSSVRSNLPGTYPCQVPILPGGPRPSSATCARADSTLGLPRHTSAAPPSTRLVTPHTIRN